MKHVSIAAMIALCLNFGCSKSTPPSAASIPVATITNVPDGVPVVVVGDPTHMPGHFGGPCKNEDCGHEACIAARKFIADEHPCAICEKPIVWGDDIITLFTDGKISKAAGGGGPYDPEGKWQSRLNEIDVLCHDKCREETLCVICNLPLAIGQSPQSGGQRPGWSHFHSHDGKWSHDDCYQSHQEKPHEEAAESQGETTESSNEPAESQSGAAESQSETAE